MCGTCGITKNNIKLNDLFPSYYRPQTKFAKAMFSQVSVCPRRGVSLSGVVSLSKGVSVQVRVSAQVGSMSRGVSVRETFIRYVRAVRILLEFILVSFLFPCLSFC